MGKSVALYRGEPGGTKESDLVMESRLEPDGGTGFGGKVGAVTRISRDSLEMGIYPSERFAWVMQRVSMGVGIPALISATAGGSFLGSLITTVGILGSVAFVVGHLLHAIPKKRGNQVLVSEWQSQAVLGLIIYALSLGGYVAIQNELMSSPVDTGKATVTEQTQR